MKNVLLALALSSATIAHAESTDANQTPAKPTPSEVTGFLGAGFAEGGDKLYSTEFTNGDNASIDSGSGLWLEGGFRTQFESWALKGSLGYKSDSVNARNGDYSFSRFPLTLVSQFSNGDHNFGAGFTYELNPKLDIDVPGTDFSIDFDNAAGFLVEYEQMNGEWSWGLRYTMIDYKVDGLKVDGNNFGLFANWYFK